MGEGSNEEVLPTFHATACGGFEVILAAQVQETVHDITSEFLLPTGLELGGLGDGIGDGDEEFAVEPVRGGAVVEGDDIGGALVTKKIPVQAAHFVGADEVDSDFGVAVKLGECSANPLPQGRQ